MVTGMGLLALQLATLLSEVVTGEELLQLDEKVDLNASYKHEHLWSSWKSLHSKNYTDQVEELLRHLTWLSNMKFIQGHNANAHIFGFRLAMNHLGDMVSGEHCRHGYDISSWVSSTAIN